MPHAARLALPLLLLAGCAAFAPKPLPPQVALEGVRVSRLAAADTRLIVALVVQNPNPYDLSVTALDAAVSLEGAPLLTGTLVAPVVLAAGAATSVEIETRTTLFAIAGALDRVSRQLAVRYEVTGVAVVQDGLRLPFRRGGELPAAALLGPRR